MQHERQVKITVSAEQLLKALEAVNNELPFKFPKGLPSRLNVPLVEQAVELIWTDPEYDTKHRMPF